MDIHKGIVELDVLEQDEAFLGSSKTHLILYMLYIYHVQSQLKLVSPCGVARKKVTILLILIALKAYYISLA